MLGWEDRKKDFAEAAEAVAESLSLFVAGFDERGDAAAWNVRLDGSLSCWLKLDASGAAVAYPSITFGSGRDALLPSAPALDVEAAVKEALDRADKFRNMIDRVGAAMRAAGMSPRRLQPSNVDGVLAVTHLSTDTREDKSVTSVTLSPRDNLMWLHGSTVDGSGAVLWEDSCIYIGCDPKEGGENLASALGRPAGARARKRAETTYERLLREPGAFGANVIPLIAPKKPKKRSRS